MAINGLLLRNISKPERMFGKTKKHDGINLVNTSIDWLK